MPSAAFVRITGVVPAAIVLALGYSHAQGAQIRPGCWDVRTDTNTIIIQPPQDAKTIEAQRLPTLDQLMQQTLAHLTPEQRAHINVTELRQEVASSLEQMRKVIELSAAASKKPLVARHVGNAVLCMANPIEALRIPAGDVQSTDAEHFKATQRQTAPNASVTVVTVAKWVSEATPHMPYSPAPTDLDGRVAKGPHDVMWLDQNRIVAVIDGQRITALEAYLVLNLPPNHFLGPDVYERGWSGLLQHNYMYWAIADEVDPKKSRVSRDQRVLVMFSAFNTGSDDGAPVDTRVANYHYIGNDRQEFDREQQLWGVYLKRATTASGKQSLTQQAEDKYKVTVVDPDFFAGRPGP